ncbi:MAG: hypothetical protein ACHQXA_00260 [Gemmatimonadales bacterium]
METIVTRPAAATDRALDGLARWFHSRLTRPGFLVRRTFGTPALDDAALAERLASALRAETRMDGSVRGEFVTTAWRAIELMDLDHGQDQSGTIRVIGYLLARQDEPGAYGETVARSEHRGRRLGGFFSPADPRTSIAPLTLPTGAVIADEADARYAASCLGLRAALKARQEERPQIRRHAESLALLATDWGSVPMPLPLACSTLHGLALAPAPMRAVIPGLIAQIGAAERHGSWVEADLFHVLQALLSVPDAAATELIGRSAPALLKLQRADEGFDGEGGIGEERGWIAMRALLRARGE